VRPNREELLVDIRRGQQRESASTPTFSSTIRFDVVVDLRCTVDQVVGVGLDYTMRFRIGFLVGVGAGLAIGKWSGGAFRSGVHILVLIAVVVKIGIIELELNLRKVLRG